MRRALPLTLLLALLLPAAAQAHQLSTSAAKDETAFYAGQVVERTSATRFKVTSCRRQSAHAVTCAFKIYGPRGYRCSGRVRTTFADDVSYDTISRAVDRCS